MKKMMMGVLLLGLIGCGQGYSNGSRVGVVTKLSMKGILLKSWEGDLVMALPAAVGITTPETFKFSVRPIHQDVVKKLNEAMRAGHRVELVYEQWLMCPLNIDTGYEIVDVKE